MPRGSTAVQVASIEKYLRGLSQEGHPEKLLHGAMEVIGVVLGFNRTRTQVVLGRARLVQALPSSEVEHPPSPRSALADQEVHLLQVIHSPAEQEPN